MYNFKFYQTNAPFGKILETNYSTEALKAVSSLELTGAYCPTVSRVITSTKTTKSVPVLDKTGIQMLDENGNPRFKKVQLDKPIYTTVVEFTDGTKSIVQCSCHDTPNVETAIVNAIVKRVLGIPNMDPKSKTYGVVDGAGTGTYLRKLAENAFDQQAEAIRVKEAKAKAKAEHQARQAKEHAEAHDRKIAKLKKEINNYIEALEQLGLVARVPGLTGQPNEKPCSCSCNKETNKTSKAKDYTESNGQWYNELPKKPIEKPFASKAYVRPNKPFSQFSQEEKREYWRAQKRGWL